MEHAWREVSVIEGAASFRTTSDLRLFALVSLDFHVGERQALCLGSISTLSFAFSLYFITLDTCSGIGTNSGDSTCLFVYLFHL